MLSSSAASLKLLSNERQRAGVRRTVESLVGVPIVRMDDAAVDIGSDQRLMTLTHFRPGARARPNRNASRFNGLDFSSEVGAKSFHQLAHPSDEVGRLNGFEQRRGKVVGLIMKDAVPTPAERLDIRRRQECVNPGINQPQIPEASRNDVQARVPIVHEVAAWAGEKFEGGEIRIL